ncbi:MAG: hypothetical protein M4D80_36125 [Myxococcota bacterium]|nr:hypothetical protein [Myxococcota bacterium]
MGDPEVVEREFMGKGRSRVWSYLILMILLVGIIVVINLTWNNPDGMRSGVKDFFGLPGWSLATVTFLIGAVIFWLGLKMETDWPEAIGAFLIAAAITWFEFIVGFDRFALGGLIVLPYLIPVLVFALLMIYGMKKSA